MQTNQDRLRRQEQRTLARADPCCLCGAAPKWGAAYLICSGCGQIESDYDDPSGNALRTWKRENQYTR